MATEEPDGGTILIVDDDLRNIRVLDQMLQNAGYDILVARNGAEGVARAERGRPDVILLDVMMPGRDGYQTCAELKSGPATAEIPVIFLSALGDSESVMKGFQAGGVDFVTKPFRQEEVLARVGVHLALRRDQRHLRDLACRLEAEADARKRTAAALAESENRLNEAQALAGMGNWEKDFETGATQWSENLFRLLGYEPGEVKPSMELLQGHLHPEDRDRFRSLLTGCLDGETGFQIEFRYLPLSGEIRHAQAMGQTDCGEAGGVIRFYGGMQDLTERKRAESALVESEARTRALLDAIPDLVFRLNRRAEILDCRAEPEELIRHDLPRDCEKLLGKTIGTLVPRFLAEWLSAAIRQAMDEKTPRRLEYKLSRAAGGPPDGRHFEARVAPSGRDEAIAMLRDITREKALERERRRMERRLETRRRLESLGVMAGGIAHDFNNILMGALGNLDLARRDLPPDGRAFGFLAKTESSLLRAAELVRQMLAYSGKSHFMFSTVVPETWMRETRPLLEKALPQGAFLEIDLPSDLPAISGDSEQLSQLLVNLAVNAAESYLEGAAGAIRIRLRSRTFVASELFQTLSELWSAYEYPMAAGRFLVVEVSDDGEGMDAEVRKRMFEPFFSTKFQGRGLGLAVVLGIVRGHGGYLRVDSTPGGGATVQVLLPAETGPSENGHSDRQSL
jgi:PAS domain S-box-containing protein